jgi:aminobenzoyl-glutamate utilization protein B
MKRIFTLGVMLVASLVHAQKKTKQDPLQAQISANKEAALKALSDSYQQDKTTALQIWDYAEVGYKEVKSAALHIQHLKEAGFTVETGVADIPTAFVAT